MQPLKYLVPCNSLQAYELTREALARLPDQIAIVSRLNNYDGTHDFIIRCKPETASLLRAQGLVLHADRKLEWQLC